MVDVTVIVPTHNRRQILPQAVHSILRQHSVSIELVVVNDGSADETRPWLDRLAATDPRVTVVHHAQPQFISGARNAGLARATGRWVAFCDDDDLWAPDKLATQLAALRAGSARWGCTGVAVVDEDLQVIGHHRVEGGDVLAGLLKSNRIPTGSTVIAERDLVREVGGFDTALRGSEDWDLWIRLAQHSPLAAVDRPLIAYRLGRQSLSMDVNPMRAGRLVIVDRYAALAATYGVRPDEAGHERYLAKQLLRGGARWQAASIFMALAFRHGRWRELPRVAAALIAPQMTDRVGQARAAAAVPAPWRQEVELWLRPIRDASQASVERPQAWLGAREREA
ncbi:glycosyltransferase family 2 protein [Bosea sp. F3-2]|uniref:glycosyltransferase family 2 protein n=1 Tax=Bosea sp. F3-2 TaxID=2599640 RepID=UPI0011EF5745|nr:glycosyltransferase [Bosea sp. F3-2]QEL22535.1 glycosyltransferase family 2 protein [Bosea sp. F3-2]